LLRNCETILAAYLERPLHPAIAASGVSGKHPCSFSRGLRASRDCDQRFCDRLTTSKQTAGTGQSIRGPKLSSAQCFRGPPTRSWRENEHRPAAVGAPQARRGGSPSAMWQRRVATLAPGFAGDPSVADSTHPTPAPLIPSWTDPPPPQRWHPRQEPQFRPRPPTSESNPTKTKRFQKSNAASSQTGVRRSPPLRSLTPTHLMNPYPTTQAHPSHPARQSHPIRPPTPRQSIPT